MNTRIKNSFFSLALLLTSGALLAQVCATPGRDSATTSIAGVINSYYPGIGGVVNAGAISLSIGGVQPSGAPAIAAGDLLIVMQMQGALIDSTNSDCYGDSVGTAGCATRTTTTASYAGGNLAGGGYKAGVWEYCTATTAAGVTVGVRCAGAGGGTVNGYEATASTGATSPGSYRYQVIRVPQYVNVSLTADVTPLAWNGTVGGVLGLQASGTVTLAGFNLDASARGFRGGGQTFSGTPSSPQFDTATGSTFYRSVVGAVPGGEAEGSFKAEGIAGTPRLVYNGAAVVDTAVDGISGGSRGRGAPGNAGGGGNNQNAGGGGGGNGGQGGQGGGAWNDFQRPTNVRDTGGFGGDGSTRIGNNLSLSVARLIMGGGGGAGHVDGGGTNCQLGAWGGNGGGIIIARVATVTGTGSFLANGGNGFAPNVAGNCTDAAGGGGAGGTIVAAVATGLAGRTLQSNGGAGVNSFYTEHGPGGGGGGGANYFNGAGSPASTANGGINGLDRGNITPQTAWFATPGANSTLNSSTGAVTTTCSSNLTVTKSNGVGTVTAGGTTSYTVTFSNLGATAANGATASDPPAAGLSCTVASCTASSTPIAAACPLAAAWPNLLTVGGVTLPTFPALSSISFVLNCGVTATGLP